MTSKEKLFTVDKKFYNFEEECFSVNSMVLCIMCPKLDEYAILNEILQFSLKKDAITALDPDFSYPFKENKLFYSL